MRDFPGLVDSESLYLEIEPSAPINFAPAYNFSAVYCKETDQACIQKEDEMQRHAILATVAPVPGPKRDSQTYHTYNAPGRGR